MMKNTLPQHPIIEAIDRSMESTQEPPREHFGLSNCGEPCARKLWLSWRWAVIEKFPARTLRIFKRGQREEEPIVELLRSAGLAISRTGDNQKEVSASRFVKGHIDGIIEAGVPESPRKMHILEIKTMNEKAFRDLEKNGLERSKPVYYIQTQVYMKLNFPVERALFVAVNKNTDEIYIERVKLDKKTAQHFIDRSVKISEAERIPDPISTDPAWYACKWCPAWSFCFERRLTQEVNCRSCSHPTPDPEKGWTCARWNNEEIPLDAQRVGCKSHVFHPDLVPWEMGEPVGEWTAQWVINGELLANGEEGYSSQEILAMGGKIPEESVSLVRKVFGGEIVGGGE